MLTKCICTNCAGHLEFEEENAGEKINCPHCGFDTTLFLPGQEPPDGESDEGTTRRRLFSKRLVIAIGMVVVLAGALGYSLYRWVLPPLKDWLPYTDSRVLPIVALGIGCVGVLLLIVWTVFPVLVFLQMRKLTDVLRQIEINGRPVLTAQPIIAEEETDKENLDGKKNDRPNVLEEQTSTRG